MKTTNLKGIIVGTVLGATLMFSAQSYAAVGDKIEAVYANFNLIVNGKSVALDETPIVVNNRSYLPVRTVADKLGYDVTYNTDIRTIEFKSVTVNPTATITPTATPTPNTASSSVIKTITKDGVTYVYISDVDVASPSYYVNYIQSSNQLNLMHNNELPRNYDKSSEHTIAISNIPFVAINGKTSITYDYFIQNIYPLFTKN